MLGLNDHTQLAAGLCIARVRAVWRHVGHADAGREALLLMQKVKTFEQQ